MNEDENTPRDTAIDWLMRRNEGLTPAERAELQAWLAADPTHRAAFEDIGGMYARLTTMELGAAPEPAQRPRRWRPWAAMAAASAALLLWVADLPIVLRADHRAGAGETQQVTLADGSRVELDARSAIALHFGPNERRLTLLEGEAWFDVAPDSKRPFVVEAAGGTVTALGTAFDVAVWRGRADVTVGQHRVAIASGGRSVIVGEGERSAYAPQGAAEPPQRTDVARATSWRQGALIFENATLAEVVEALGRYRRGHVLFADPSLRARRVSGVFGSSDPGEALEEIEAALGLRALSLTRYLTILYE